MGGEEHVVGLDGGADEEAGEWDGGEADALGQVRVCEYVGIVVFCQDVEEAAVYVWFCGVEFRDVGVLDPVD